jgi:predicted 2-oxoglutarate/Fe(II)-dependent dioxygenase YbiX/peroxiredoxin
MGGVQDVTIATALTTGEQIAELGGVAPWFTAPSLGGLSDYSFDTVAGRPVLLLFFPSASNPAVSGAVSHILTRTEVFNDVDACFFGVTSDPEDAAEGRIARRIPGVRYILDYDRNVVRSFGLGNAPEFVLLDRQLRYVARYALEHIDAAIAHIVALQADRQPQEWAPVLLIPRIFEPELCTELIRHYDSDGGRESGYMRVKDGKTVRIVNHKHKRRSDCVIDDPALRELIVMRIHYRLRPMIQRAFQFDASRMERYIVACYDSEVGGYFKQHRDNTTEGTAHRRFAVTINLNAEDYDGGELRFPEFGSRTYRAPTGGAVVFSCGLLHEATPVTRGRRYAFLPFLYDDAAATIRERNNAYLGEGVGQYQRDKAASQASG